ncbi:MAG: hypothetical protein AAB604_01385 [Patescibacteria group bacterium]
MTMQVMQNKKMSDVVHRQVMAALREILSDPDQGMTLRSNAVRRLKSSIRAKQIGKVKNLIDVLAQYGI